MFDYGNLGLNAQLNSNDSLAAKEDKFVSGNEFDANFDKGVITTTKLGSAVVGSAQIGIGEVHTANLADAAVITSKFGTNSVTSDILGSLAVTAGKIAANVIAGSNIMGSTIGGTNIAAAAIGTAEIGVAAVGAAAIQALAVGSAAIGTAAIQAVHLGTAIIGTANIGTLSFNEISGGTAILGGTLNGNGVLSLKDSGGTERVLLDNIGITVNGGSIIIKNSTGGTTMDSLGIVSLTNFNSGGTVTSPNQSFTLSSYNDVNNTTVDIALAKAAKVLILSQADMYLSGSGVWIGTGEVGISIGGTAPVKSYLKRGEQTADHSHNPGAHISTHGASLVQTLNAGTTTVKLQARISDISGTPSFIVFTADLNYTVLGN